MTQFKAIFLVAGFTLVSITTFALPTDVKYLSGIDKDNPCRVHFLSIAGATPALPPIIPGSSCLEMQDFGIYQFSQNRSISNAETGLYTNTFAISSAWTGKKTFLFFEGAFTSQLFDDLKAWSGSDQHPGYSSISTSINDTDTVFTVHPRCRRVVWRCQPSFLATENRVETMNVMPIFL